MLRVGTALNLSPGCSVLVAQCQIVVLQLLSHESLLLDYNHNELLICRCTRVLSAMLSKIAVRMEALF